MKRLFAMLLCSALLLGASGCGGGMSPDPSRPAGESGRVELKWYINFSWYNTPWGGNAVSDAITEKAGVDITFVSPAGSETETPDALIAGNNLPDLVTLGWWEDQLSAIIDKSMVYALNELADEYDPYFWQAADEERLNWYRLADGNVYCYPNSSYAPWDYGEDARIGSDQTFLVRKDIYEAIGSPDMTTTCGTPSCTAPGEWPGCPGPRGRWFPAPGTWTLPAPISRPPAYPTFTAQGSSRRCSC